MNILFLGPYSSPVREFLEACGNTVYCTSSPIEQLRSDEHDYIVSHGYRHIIPEEICNKYYGRSVNLHISYLPFNRGADPNLWSWIDDTKKGVTLHEIAPQVDAGRVLLKKQVWFGEYETLKTSYDKLQHEILILFKSYWLEQFGTYHRTSDRRQVEHLLTKGWDTPVAELRLEKPRF